MAFMGEVYNCMKQFVTPRVNGLKAAAFGAMNLVLPGTGTLLGAAVTRADEDHKHGVIGAHVFLGIAHMFSFAFVFFEYKALREGWLPAWAWIPLSAAAYAGTFHGWLWGLLMMARVDATYEEVAQTSHAGSSSRTPLYGVRADGHNAQRRPLFLSSSPPHKRESAYAFQSGRSTAYVAPYVGEGRRRNTHGASYSTLFA